MRKVAIFDIDGTIFRSSLLIELIDALINEGLMPKRTAKEYLQAHTAWLNREGSYDDYIEAVVRAFMRHINGVPRRDLLRVSKRVVAKSGRHVYRFTRQLIVQLRKKGYFLLAISNSPKMVLDSFCKQWGFDMVYGRIYDTDLTGKMTNKILHLDLITDKAKILKRAVEKYQLTLIGSVGVGDSEGDIPFLELVDRPICFNPNKKLYNAAKRRGWQVVVERKDVIYKRY
jgi:HAD superfamily hydrolase (TIGR01490 family)